eukprot:TRINITY_DN8084_c0_g1_i1.p1 TRINITY_DN8084_c0_g1~~TRINITY_DN8084_c0_g1_i1.p1  ORF type:complete len:545 (-),score=136.32 TRINITY_DN8084_c0_g1_i1:95-1603(-)
MAPLDDASTCPPPTADTDFFLADGLVGTSQSLHASDWDQSATLHDLDLEAMAEEGETMTEQVTIIEGELSARSKGLLVEAETRAEQQAAARVTMLDLAEALENAARRQQYLQTKLNKEMRINEDLRNEISSMRPSLDKAEAREEQLMERRMHDLMPVNETLLAAASFWAQYAFPLNIMSPGAPLDGPRAEPTKGDYLAAREYFMLWKELSVVAKKEAMDGPMAKHKSSRELNADGDWEEKLKREQLVSAALQQKLDAMVNEMKKLELKLQRADEEKDQLRREADMAASKLRAEIDNLQKNLADAKREISEKDATVRNLEQALANAEEDKRRMHEHAEAEKKALHSQLRDLAVQLQETVVNMRQFKEQTYRAKQTAVGSVSPEKFAMLLAELETMKDKLALLGREGEFERENAAWLRAKLDQNRRRLELERQFLPLLHKARGPVGPKNPALKGKKAADFELSVGPQPVPPSPEKRMGQSMSASMIDGARKASSAGFSNSNKGF